MVGVKPPYIITDQCHAITAAIKKVFPETTHRYCIWHIMQKAHTKLPVVPEKKFMIKHLKEAVYQSCDEVEFEMAWTCFLLAFPSLEKNSWISNIYANRTMWVPAYLKDYFFAGMSSTQRSESMNAFFDKYLNSKTNLQQFVQQYDLALHAKYEKESKSDFDSKHKAVSLLTRLPFENQMRELYTVAAFKKFQEQMSLMMCVNINHIKNIGNVITVKGVERKDIQAESLVYYTYKDKHFEVSILTEGEVEVIRCDCKMFESQGFLCSHVLATMKQLLFDYVPEKYILDRWRKDVRRQYHLTPKPQSTSDNTGIGRYEDIVQKTSWIAEEASVSQENHKIALQVIEEIKAKFFSLRKVDDTAAETETTKKRKGKEPCGPEEIKNPKNVKRIGRPPTNRRQSTAEKITQRYRNYQKAKGSTFAYLFDLSPDCPDQI